MPSETTAPPRRATAQRRRTTRPRLVALSLTGRALINASFAFWLWRTQPDWSSFFDASASYLLADGIVALVSGALLANYSIDGARLLGAATATEGSVRLAVAIGLLVFPGLPDFPVTAVALFGVIGVCTALLALVAISIRLAVWRKDRVSHHAEPLPLHEALDPLFVVGIVALAVVAGAFVFGPPATIVQYRILGIRWAATLTIAFGVAALGVVTSPGPHAVGSASPK